MRMLLLLISFLLLPTVSYGNNVLFGSPVAVTATTTSTSVLAKNSLRSYLIIVNTGSATAYVKFGSVQSGAEGVPIPAGGNYEPFESPANSVWVRTATGSTTLTLIQGQ